MLYANTRDREGGFGVPKVIFNRMGTWNPPILDMRGQYGMSESIFAIPIASREEGEAMIRFFTPEMCRIFEKSFR